MDKAKEPFRKQRKLANDVARADLAEMDAEATARAAAAVDAGVAVRAAIAAMTPEQKAALVKELQAEMKKA